MWILGHLVTSEAGMTAGFLLGERNPMAKWDALFGMGSEPVADASRYPSWDELLATFEKVRANTLKLLDTYSEVDLDRPSKAPEPLRQSFGTVGQVLQMVAHHAVFHAGQVADARRTAGKKPVMG